jgi:uncharacterized protein
LALRDRLELIRSIKDTPHRISLAFALGVFIGMSPFLGIHTVLGILVAWLFRLNKLATIIGVYVTNPYTIIPIYTFGTWVGVKCLGINTFIPAIDWRHISVSTLMNEFSSVLKPFIVGTLLIGVLAAILSYILVYNVTKRRYG